LLARKHNFCLLYTLCADTHRSDYARYIPCTFLCWIFVVWRHFSVT